MPAHRVRSKRATTTAWSSVVVLALLFGGTWFLGRTLRLVKVPSESMEPTLRPGDVLTMRIDAFRHSMPQRGDIVVFHSKQNNGELLIKRVVGQPGESITVWSGRVWINGKRLQEDYAAGKLILEAPETVTLAEDECWVMGDNRDFSQDSRDYGPVGRKQLVGRANAIIWPMDRRGDLPRE